MFNKKGFTLVELMIVVAIIGILAAIAIPNFVAMQYRAKRAEVPSNVDGIKTAQLAYDAAFDVFINEPTFQPRTAITGAAGKTQADWIPTSRFQTLGWAPDGKVRGIYKVNSISSTDFRVNGQCNVDGDTVLAEYTATKSINSVPTPTTTNTVF
ncbi:MAG: hypothetical protein RL071_1279 [Pseudomonadota bacterium]|jgi:type IV pilus assembly protein PilA